MSPWRHWWRRAESERMLERELQAHLQLHVDDLMAQGLSEAEARRVARLELGGPEQVKEGCRDSWGTRWLEDFVQDTRYALRALRRQRVFSTVGLLTLGLGIGAVTVMFTVLSGVLLKPLNYPEPERLVSAHEETAYATAFGHEWAFSYPNFVDCRKAARTVDIAAFRFGGGTLSGRGTAEFVSGRQVSANVFDVLKTPMALGRGFTGEEDSLGGAPVMVLGQGLWQRRFASDAGVLGSTVTFEGRAYTVVGVLPAWFRLDGDDVDLFTPIGQSREPVMTMRAAHPGIQVVGRLRDGATLEQARAELASIGAQLARAYPDTNRARSFAAQVLRPQVGDVRQMLWLLLGAAAVLLLIACANVASLLLARAVAREREMAMRVALGAGRWRLVRQCLTESLVLGLAGGALGVGFAALGVRPFLAFWPGVMPRVEEIQLDWRVMAFAVAASVGCGVLFGLLPALRAPARDMDLRGRGVGAAPQGWFVAAEIALAVVLLVSAGTLGRTLARLSSLDAGLDTRNVLVPRMALSPGAMTEPERMRSAWRDVLARARAVPGVEAVSMVDTVPMRPGNNQVVFSPKPGRADAADQALALATCVTPEYPRVMGLRLRAGRFFTEQDRAGTTPVVVIDEEMARRAFGTGDAVGQRLWIPDLGSDAFVVAGVVGHVRHWGPALDDAAQVRAQFYYPFAQLPDRFVRRWSELMSLAVRTSGPPLEMMPALRQALRGAGGDQVLYEIRTLDELARDTLARQRFLLFLFGLFAVLALGLACGGLYGVLAYLTNRRVAEFGVRLALGATASDVARLVLRQSLRWVALGLAGGCAAAWAAGPVLRHLVAGVQPAGVAMVAAMAMLLVPAALAAAYGPARRAGRIDPVRALRAE